MLPISGGLGQESRLERRGLPLRPGTKVESLSPHVLERQATFDEALGAFRGAIPPEERTEVTASILDLSKNHFSNVLLLHMAANAAARGKTLESEDALFEEALGHERHYWRQHLAPDIPTAPFQGPDQDTCKK
jgi:hypothetical protein